MGPFRDRHHAGRVLAQRLEHYRSIPDLLILALPRGGVPVAFEVAKALHASLDVFVVRKLGLPGHEELAMGAVATGGVCVLNQEVLDAFYVPQAAIERVARMEQKELERQQLLYRQDRAAPRISGRTVILVDDGLATGSTMRAALKALRKQNAQKLVVAVPVGASETCDAMQEEADECVCAIDSNSFMSVGSWYDDFRPTSDAEVEELLIESAKWQDEALVN